jgi:hypothetical protein
MPDPEIPIELIHKSDGWYYALMLPGHEPGDLDGPYDSPADAMADFGKMLDEVRQDILKSSRRP